MSEGKEYKVGEIFRNNGETFQCVFTDQSEGVYCLNCEAGNQLCETLICHEKERSDKKNVHFIRVTEPEDGMLFRASDGKLYELKKLEARVCGCYLYGYMSCLEIDEEAFGEMIPEEDLHWHPVEEKKEEEKEMSENKRHIELAVVKVDGDQVTFKISEQTHRCDDFAPKGCKFKSHSGYRLISESCPHADACMDGLFVRGWLRQMDDAEVTANVETFARIMEAITEYNETNGYEKPWPQYADKYYYVGDNGEVILSACGIYPTSDKKRILFGNTFRTREDAEAALERVKKALKGE